MASTPAPRFTLISTRDPDRIGKVYSVTDGVPTRRVIMNYTSAAWLIVESATPEAFADLLAALEPGVMYLTAGLPSAPEGNIGIEDKSPVLRKTNENFPFRPSPGLLTLDCDAELSLEELLLILDEAAPGLSDAAVVWLPSSSSYLYNGAEAWSDLKGSHAFIAVEDATDIPRAGEALFRRLWLAGAGWLKVSTAGAALLRSPFDRAMLRPAQPIFAAGAACDPPMRQERGTPRISRGRWPIDSQAAIPDLTPAETRRFNRMTKAARDAAADDCKTIQKRWLAERVDALARLRAGPDADAAALAAAAARVDREALHAVLSEERASLPLDWVLTLRDGTLITVQDVLERPKVYHGAVCFDPLSPAYLAGIIYSRQATPIVHSESGAKLNWELGTKADRETILQDRAHMRAVLESWSKVTPARRPSLLRALAGRIEE